MESTTIEWRLHRVVLDLPTVLFKLSDQITTEGEEMMVMSVCRPDGSELNVSVQKQVATDGERLLLDVTAPDGGTVMAQDSDKWTLDLGNVQSPVYLQSSTRMRDTAAVPKSPNPDLDTPPEPATTQRRDNIVVTDSQQKIAISEAIEKLDEPCQATQDVRNLTDILASGEFVVSHEDEQVVMAAGTVLEGQTIGILEDGQLEGTHDQVQIQISGSHLLDVDSAVVLQVDDRGYGSENNKELDHFDVLHGPENQDVTESLAVGNTNWWDAGGPKPTNKVDSLESFQVSIQNQEAQDFVTVKEEGVLLEADQQDSYEIDSGEGFQATRQDLEAQDFVTVKQEKGRVLLRGNDRSSLSTGEIAVASSIQIQNAKDIPRMMMDINGFKCSLCTKIYNSIKLLQGHFQRCHQECTYREADMEPVLIKDAYLCFICHQPFRRFDTVRKHLESIHKMAMLKRKISKLITCPICFSKHSSYHTLRCHLSYKHRRDKQYDEAIISLQTQSYQKPSKRQDCVLLQCPWCDLQLTMKQFRHHVNTAHKKEPQTDFVIKEALDAIKIQKQEKYRRSMKQCMICKKVFPMKQYYTHMRRVHRYSSKPMNNKCGTCNKEFGSNWHLKMHLLIHTDEKNFKCDACGKAFRHKYALQHHTKTVHLQIYPFSCNVCHRGFNVNRALLKHVCDPFQKRQRKLFRNPHDTEEPLRESMETGPVSHSETDNMDTDISISVSVNARESQMSKVNWKDYADLLPSGHYKCRECAKEYKSRMSISTHLRRVHHISNRPIEEHKCNVCEKSFILQSKLKSHMTTHSDPAHHCTLCQKSFRDKYLLNSHTRVVHKRCYTYTCKQCGQGYEKRHKCEASASTVTAKIPRSVTRSHEGADPRGTETGLRVYEGSEPSSSKVSGSRGTYSGSFVEFIQCTTARDNPETDDKSCVESLTDEISNNESLPLIKSAEQSVQSLAAREKLDPFDGDKTAVDETTSDVMKPKDITTNDPSKENLKKTRGKLLGEGAKRQTRSNKPTESLPPTPRTARSKTKPAWLINFD